MSQSPPNVVAIIIVADSSIAIQAEWFRILTDYVPPLFGRLGEANPPPLNTIRLGFVTYGIASTYPSPILCERFFQAPASFNKEVKEDFQRLGIGQTGTGKQSGGMAALEGLVNAMEMFDQGRKSMGLSSPPDHTKKRSVMICHIIHIAAAPPDSSVHPSWNKDPAFDDITWETLPAEFKKREINYSLVMLKPLPRLREIQATLAPVESLVTPWFNHLPHHTVFLSGFPNKGTKRPTETPATAPSDQKRPRQDSISRPSPNLIDTPSITSEAASISPTVSTFTTSSSAPSLAPSSVPTSVAGSTPALISAPTLPQINTPNPSAPPAAQSRPSAHFSSLSPNQQQQIAHQYKTIQQDIKQLTEHAAIAQRDGRTPNVITDIKLEWQKKMAMLARLQAMITGGAPFNPAALSANPVAPAIGNNQTASNNTPQLPNIPPGTNYSPEVMAQIQKMMEQKNQQLQAQNRPTAAPAAGPPATQAPNPQQQQFARWQGTITFTGLDPFTQVPKELMIAVAAQGALGNTNPQVQTWPKNLYLTYYKEAPMASHQDFQAWIKKHRPALCQFTPLPLPGVDPKINELNARQLIQILTEKNVYALAAWDLPTGQRNSNNLILLPFKTSGLIGAVFPTTGIPEMPQTMAQAAPALPGMQQWLANANRQNQGQGQGVQGRGPAPGQVQGSGQQFPMRVDIPQFAGMQPAQQMQAGGGGSVPGVSMDMLQSFIARKNEGQPMQ